MDFFQIHVPMWRWWLSQVLGICAIAMSFVSVQQKTKSKQLYVQSGVNIIMLVVNLLILNMAMAALGIILFFQNMTLARMDVRKDNLPNWSRVVAFVVFTALYLVAMYTVWRFWNNQWTWFNYVLLAGAITLIFIKVFKNIHWMKWTIFCNNIVMIINALMFANIMSVVKSSVKMTSVILFYSRGKHKNSKPQTIDDTLESTI